MYTYEDYDGKHVTVKATHTRYHSRFLADDETMASMIVADLNRPLVLQQLADHRFQVETQGIMVGEQSVNTDRESQAQLNGAFNSLKNELITQTRWKGPSGFVTVDLDALTPIAQAVASHVNDCFNTEGEIADELASIVDHTQMSGYDVVSAFDQRYTPPSQEEETLSEEEADV